MDDNNIEHTRKRLIFRSWHRGTKEMDLLMGSFADQHVPTFTREELSHYDDILKQNDPDLYIWIMGTEQPPSNIVTPVLERLIAHQYKQTSHIA